jgi:hypothetical protein
MTLKKVMQVIFEGSGTCPTVKEVEHDKEV